MLRDVNKTLQRIWYWCTQNVKLFLFYCQSGIFTLKGLIGLYNDFQNYQIVHLSNIAIAILDFSPLFLLLKLSLFNYYCDINSCRSYSLSKAIAICVLLLFAIAFKYVNRATTIAVGRAITVWEAKQKRSHEPIYKNYTKIIAKGSRATTLLSQSWKSDN